MSDARTLRGRKKRRPFYADGRLLEFVLSGGLNARA
jgi:hypothetical protein